MSFGSPPGVRKFDIRFKDAVKLGYNTAAFSEISQPAQDYRMVSAFTYNDQTWGHVAASLNDIDRAHTIYPAGDPPGWRPLSSGAVTQLFFKPVVFHHYVMNPTIAAICLDVEVYGWRRGYHGITTTLEECYFKGISMNTQSVATARVVTQPKDTYQVSSSVPPGIHTFPSVIAPVDAGDTNAKGFAVEQIFNVERMRMRQLKLLSKRKCVTIPAGGIYHFKIMMRMPQGIPPEYFSSAEWGDGPNPHRHLPKRCPGRARCVTLWGPCSTGF